MRDPLKTSPENIAVPALPVRIAQVFVSPAKLFDALRERPAWIGAFVGLVLVGVGLQLVTPAIVPEETRRAMFESQITRFMPAGTDPAVVEEQVDNAMSGGATMNIATVVIATPIFISLIAGLLLIGFNVVGGGEARFKQLFSAVAHAMYVSTAGGAVAIVLMALGSQDPMLTPGLLLPDLGGFAGRFLNGINVFSVWTCVVLGVAVSRIYSGRSVTAGMSYLLALYLLFVAVIAMLAGLVG